ncbi:MAG TPA: nitroreductase family deazaflavin-dependent oxidoreductase [Candidatus Binataceae bacterium]|nr:nitroreductase family deazaflavin-dependent oxidoreductase [Candidatus Binataceae bacterium]
MDERVKQGLEREQIIDISTVGRKSGQARRIEIRLHYLDGKFYLSGTPGRPRSWYANLRAHPGFILHLKQHVQADLRARATPILEPAQRRAIFEAMKHKAADQRDVDAWTTGSPLVAVELVDQ